MSKKVIYEVFNPATGKFEDKETTQDEIDKAFDQYLHDYSAYKAEQEIVQEIIKQHLTKDERNLD
tara:strand:- start:84 stop:278 length:195 start_codon:yes stop_codon:yes gene_type:complete